MGVQCMSVLPSSNVTSETKRTELRFERYLTVKKNTSFHKKCENTENSCSVV